MNIRTSKNLASGLSDAFALVEQTRRTVKSVQLHPLDHAALSKQLASSNSVMISQMTTAMLWGASLEIRSDVAPGHLRLTYDGGFIEVCALGAGMYEEGPLREGCGHCEKRAVKDVHEA